MRDAVGNKLTEGNLVFWRSTGLVYKVLRVEDSLLVSPHGPRPDARIVLELSLPIPVDKLRYDEEPQLPDVFALRDPKEESLLDRALAGAKPQ